MYHYAANNPIKYTDPDGRNVAISFAKGFWDAAVDEINGIKDFLSDIPGALSDFADNMLAIGKAIINDPKGFGAKLFEEALASAEDFLSGSADEIAYELGKVAEVIVVAYLTGKAVGKIKDLFKGLKFKKLPMETHHFATNKSSRYTGKMNSIAKKYGLDLDGAWNKKKMPHRGRHPNKYHEFVLDGMYKADVKAKGNPKKFLKYFDKYVKKPVEKNPGMLRKSFWGD